jgi:hypothetical protein
MVTQASDGKFSIGLPPWIVWSRGYMYLLILCLFFIIFERLIGIVALSVNHVIRNLDRAFLHLFCSVSVEIALWSHVFLELVGLVPFTDRVRCWDRNLAVSMSYLKAFSTPKSANPDWMAHYRIISNALGYPWVIYVCSDVINEHEHAYGPHVRLTGWSLWRWTMELATRIDSRCGSFLCFLFGVGGNYPLIFGDWGCKKTMFHHFARVIPWRYYDGSIWLYLHVQDLWISLRYTCRAYQ